MQHNFYNLVDPKQVNLYGRPPNALNDAIWQKAVQENPDPSCLVPVIAIGFDDLRARIDAQSSQSSLQLQKIADLQSRLSALRTQHAISNASRLLRAAATQTQVVQRLMRFIQHLHLLIPSMRSSALRPEEEALRGKLEELEEEMRRGRVKGRLNELWAVIGAISASADRASGAGGGGGASGGDLSASMLDGGAGGGAPGEWAVVDEEGLAQIAQILAEQQAGLQHLTKILQKGQKDLGVILGKRNLSSSSKDGGEEIPGEMLWGSTTSAMGGSTSTLRASALR
ncbi:hypothetical protein CPC08DRAFT_737499 [Agrocybe pediades]|nr:hypothetical protein CPC08DRAFT_737499 [Agrocybe pediades]